MSEPTNTAATIGIVIVAVVASCFALYFGGDFLAPVVFAFLLNAVFRPLVRGSEKMRVPTWVSAAVVVLGLTAALVMVGVVLSRPVRAWLQEAPQIIDTARGRLQRLTRSVQQVKATAQKIENGVQPDATTKPAAPEPPLQPGLATRIFGKTANGLTFTLEALLLLYLLLSAGDLFLQKLIDVMPTARDKRMAVQVVHEVQTVVFRYLVTMAAINATQGAVIATLMWLLGMPTPWLWGLFTFVFEFVPYLGASVMIGLLAITAFATFQNLGHILLAPATYFVVATIQTSIVSPIAYGQRLKLNPVAVFLGVLFWWFLWGVPGAFLAVPIIATMKITFDRVEGLRAVGEFLGE